jgi:hypothetical protein
MNQRTIAISELPNKDLDCEFDLKKDALFQIYEFYKNHSQKDVYVIEKLSGPDRSKYVYTDFSVYNSYGIYFDGEVMDLESKKHMLILTENDLVNPDALNDAIAQACYDCDCEDFDCIVIEKVYDKYGTGIEQDNELVGELFPGKVFLNRGFKPYKKEIVYARRNVKNTTMIDVAEIFNRHNMNSLSTNQDVRTINEIAEEIEKLNGPNVMFYYSRNLTNCVGTTKIRCDEIFASLAAYFTCVRHFKFDVPKGDVQYYYMSSAEKLLSSRYCFASDFVRLMQHPLRKGFSFRNGDAFVCSLADLGKQQAVIKVIQAEFVEDGLRSYFDDSSIRHTQYNASDVTVLNVEDVFSVCSRDWNTAVEGFRAINKFCTEFEISLSEFIGESLDIPVCFNNLLLFEVGSKKYVGYIASKQISIPYAVKDYDQSFEATVVRHKSLNSVFDFSVLADGNLFRERMISKGTMTRDESVVPFRDYAKGVIHSRVAIHNGMLKEDSKATVAEIGVWSPITNQLRGLGARKILDRITNIAAWKSGFLTYFGGPHPATQINVNVSPEAWR